MKLKTLAIIATLGMTSVALQAETVIRVGLATPKTSPIYQALEYFKNTLDKRSNGDFDVQLFPGGQLGSVNEMTELVQAGSIQMTTGASVLLSSVVPEFNILDTFYLFKDKEQARRVLDGKGGDMLKKAMEEKGLKGVGFFERGFRDFSNNRAPLDSVESFKGLRMRAASNPTQIAAWKSIGAAPMPLNWGEIYPSLQQSLIDGQESALSSMYLEHFYEVQKYISLTQHSYTAEVWFTNTDFWDSLSPKQQKLLNEVAIETVSLERKLTVKANNDALNAMKAKGLIVNKVPLKVKEALGKKMNETIKGDIVKHVGQRFYDQFNAQL
ncbi:TRAP transporter substrate-binding protein [Marinomonas sp. TI.3.20]|uniref:TRAP transporter substrate-binding protein n=1 Tax=Marinomonas sp. TI.3.20 TaxID=3121296 RepID=UPI0031203795